ncbi:MAG: MFS transporter [Bacteroidetes bacterium]|jgi:predicted MFS family arabinose efflux permease|nr:MFS transporter [Bacteroidota bacterium]
MLSKSKAVVKGAYSGLSTEVWLLSLVMLINRSGTMVIFFLSVYLTQVLHFTLQQTGVMLACFGAGSFTGAFLGGRLTDKIGYHPVMLWSLFIGGVLFLMIPLIKTYLLLCIFFFILSSFSEAFRPANMAAISFHSKPENYTRSVSLNRLAINLGFSVGPAIGGLLASLSYHYIFIANGIACMTASLIIFISLKNKMKRKTAEMPKPLIKSPYRDKNYLLFLVVAYLYALCFFQFFLTMPLYYKTMQLNETQIGYLMALNGIMVAAIEMIMIYKIEGKTSVFNFIALGAALLLVAYLSIPFISGFAGFALLVAIISFSEMFAMPFMNTFMNNQSDDSSRGQYAALFSMSWSSAQTTLPIIATQTIALLGYQALWIGMAFASLLTMLFIKMIGKRMESQSR